VELTKAASRFVPFEFLQFLNKQNITEAQLGDQIQQEMAILVSDIRSFTTLSEMMTPQQNFDFVNAYLGHVGPIIRQHRGFVVKYMGDGIMAVFPQRAEDALRSAIEQLRQMGVYNAERQQAGLMPVQIGLGLHAGKIMMGIVGEAERIQADLLADAVNLAARLEGLSKMYGASIIISHEILARLDDPLQYKLRFLGKVQVKGRQEAVAIFDVFDGDPPEILELKLRTRSEFEEGLNLYHHKKFGEAQQLFKLVLQHNPHDKATRLYLEQSAHYLTYGVPDNWNGVLVLTEK
jgi:two-component system sensor histidine kinase ChiS